MKKINFIFLMLFAVCISANAQLIFLYEYNPTNSAIPDYPITGLAAAPNGDVWVATDGGGVARKRGSTWTVFNTSNSQIAFNSIDKIFVARNGDVWLSYSPSNNGSGKFDGTTWTTYQYSFLDITDDSDNNIWMTGYSMALLKYDGTNTTIFDENNSPLSQYGVGSGGIINAITTDASDNIWVATPDSFFKYTGSAWTFYDSSAANSLCFVESLVKLDMMFDKTGVLWIAHGAGITSFNGTIWTDYDANDYGSSLVPAAVNVSSNNFKYFSTYSDGVLRFDGTNWIQYKQPDDLPIYVCYNAIGSDIAIDKNGYKWITCRDDGSVAYFQDGGGTGVEELDNKYFSISPNPTNNHLNITTTLQGNEGIQYQIINTLGGTVLANKATTKDFSIDVSTLPAGIYFIHLQSGNAETVKRFVKE